MVACVNWAAPHAQVHLNPATELSDLPLKAFYRYALPGFASAPGDAGAAPGACGPCSAPHPPRETPPCNSQGACRAHSSSSKMSAAPSGRERVFAPGAHTTHAPRCPLVCTLPRTAATRPPAPHGSVSSAPINATPTHRPAAARARAADGRLRRPAGAQGPDAQHGRPGAVAGGACSGARLPARARAPPSSLCTRRAGRGRAPAIWPATKRGWLRIGALSLCVPVESGIRAHARLGPAPCNYLACLPPGSHASHAKLGAPRDGRLSGDERARVRRRAAQAPLGLDNLHQADSPYPVPYLIPHHIPYPVPYALAACPETKRLQRLRGRRGRRAGAAGPGQPAPGRPGRRARAGGALRAGGAPADRLLPGHRRRPRRPGARPRRYITPPTVSSKAAMEATMGQGLVATR
jgi:hypothetical protein